MLFTSPAFISKGDTNCFQSSPRIFWLFTQKCHEFDVKPTHTFSTMNVPAINTFCPKLKVMHVLANLVLRVRVLFFFNNRPKSILMIQKMTRPQHLLSSIH